MVNKNSKRKKEYMKGKGTAVDISVSVTKAANASPVSWALRQSIEVDETGIASPSTNS